MKKMWAWFRENSQAISVLGTFVATAFLIYDVWLNRDIASVAREQLSLEKTPYATFSNSLKAEVQGEGGNFEQTAASTNWISFSAEVINVSKVPIAFLRDKACFENDCEDIDDKEQSILYPQQSMKFITKKFFISPVAPDEISGTLTLKIIYWAVGSENRKAFFLRGYRLLKNEGRWLSTGDQFGSL